MLSGRHSNEILTTVSGSQINEIERLSSILISVTGYLSGNSGNF